MDLEILTWINKHGGRVENVNVEKMKDYEGYGVHAAREIEAGEKTISIPWKLTMNCESVQKTPLGKAIDSSMPEDEILALHLMFEKTRRSESFWYLFIQSLPETFNTPLFWSMDELNELKGTNVFELTKMMKKQLHHDYETMHLPLMESHPDLFPQPLPFDLYLWAMSIIWSRAFGVGKAKVLCPVMDMFNHDVEITCPLDDFISYDKETRMLTHTASFQTNSKTQLLISYGNYSNAKLLYTYGFIDVANSRRRVDFWINIPPNDPCAVFKTELLAKHGIFQTYDFEGTLFGDSVSERLLATMRIALMTQDEHIKAGNAFKAQPISRRNESVVVDSLIMSLRRKLQTMATSIAEDTRLLSTEISERHRMAIQVRLEDKLVLQDTIQYLTTYRASLNR